MYGKLEPSDAIGPQTSGIATSKGVTSLASAMVGMVTAPSSARSIASATSCAWHFLQSPIILSSPSQGEMEQLKFLRAPALTHDGDYQGEMEQLKALMAPA